jgi:hypothetical protein
MKRLVADTGPILHLHEASALHLLPLMVTVYAPPQTPSSAVRHRRISFSQRSLGKGVDSTAANLVKISRRFLTADHQSPVTAFQLLIEFLFSLAREMASPISHGCFLNFCF